jgi:hypothetical protein
MMGGNDEVALAMSRHWREQREEQPWNELLQFFARAFFSGVARLRFARLALIVPFEVTFLIALQRGGSQLGTSTPEKLALHLNITGVISSRTPQR